MTAQDTTGTSGAVRGAFASCGRFVLTTHVNPDGDAIGSEIALAAWLRGGGKEVHVINVSPLPPFYRFLDPAGSIAVYDPRRHDALIAGADAIVVLDANHPGRLRDMARAVMASPALRICIDHHTDPDPFAAHALIDTGATSTGEILFTLLYGDAPGRIDPVIAGALYCAIMTDTGSFRYPRTGPLTHRIAARLIESGADPVAIFSAVYEQWTPARMRLLGEAIAAMETAFGGRLAHITVTRAMFARTHTTVEDTENFTVYPMSVAGVAIGILFLETDEGLKMSFRSRGSIPVNTLAAEFGGNGHLNAAGARVSGPTDDVRARVLQAAEKYIGDRA